MIDPTTGRVDCFHNDLHFFSLALLSKVSERNIYEYYNPESGEMKILIPKKCTTHCEFSKIMLLHVRRYLGVP